MGNPALDEFRQRFTAALLNTLVNADAESMRAAVDQATQGWTAKFDRDLVRDADGKTVDEARDLVSKIVEPVTRIVRITATGQIARDETDEEAQARTGRIEAMLWDAEDGPPPSRVGVLQLLDQRIWWCPKGADPIKLKDMEPSHRYHLLHWLRRNAPRFKNAADWSFVGSMAGPMGPAGDMAMDAVERIADELFEMSPTDWIERQPLVKRLRKLVARDEKAAVRNAETTTE